MASFATHLPLLLLLIALMPNISTGRSFRDDEYGVSNQEEEEPIFFHNTGDSYGLSYNPSTSASNDDDGDLTKSLDAYEQGINYAKLVKNGMNNYGVKVVDNNNDDDGDGDDSLNKSLESYERGVNYAKFIKEGDVDNYDVKAINDDNNNDDDDGDDSFNKSLEAFARAMNYAESMKKEDVDEDVGVKEITNQDKHYYKEDDDDDDGDDSLNKSLEAYAQGVNYAKSMKKEDVDEDDVGVEEIANQDKYYYKKDLDDGDDPLIKSLEAYARGVNYAKSMKKEDIDEDGASVKGITNKVKHYYKEDLDDDDGEDLP